MKSPGYSDNVKTVKSKESEKELHIPLSEKLKLIPEALGIRVNEEPEYEVLKKDGDFEIRRYQNQVLAEVTLKATEFDEFREAAFQKLAAYIFGGNIAQAKMGAKYSDEIYLNSAPPIEERKSENIAMTAPVLQEEGFNKEWTMSFVLPKKYTLATAPKPLNDEIQLREVAGYDAAVVRYSGTSTSQTIKEHEAKLSKWIKEQPELQLNGTFVSAQYDAPFVIPFLRRNEVMIKIGSLQ